MFLRNVLKNIIEEKPAREHTGSSDWTDIRESDLKRKGASQSPESKRKDLWRELKIVIEQLSQSKLIELERFCRKKRKRILKSMNRPRIIYTLHKTAYGCKHRQEASTMSGKGANT